ncbi:MAG: serine/threonine protein kinase [Myxococcales bacterium]|nr:serine/threonine protein kinase [Myxococcales bacterium]
MRTIGRGGMGAVYEAIHTDLEKRVALKALRPDVSHDEQTRARFLREGNAAARIRHPHVAEVFDVGQEGNQLYLVMEFLEGHDLGARLDREGQLAVEDAVDILIPVCAALAVAHEEGVVHRDLKPENIFLAKTRHGVIQPKLLDFGISKLKTPRSLSLTVTSVTLGTPIYMAPEQAMSGRAADARSDQYTLGVILYECVCGRPPVNGDDAYPVMHAIVNGDYPLPRQINPELEPEFEAVLMQAMALKADARYPNMQAFGAALLPFAGASVRAVWTPVFKNGKAASIKPPTGRSAPDKGRARSPEPARDTAVPDEPDEPAARHGQWTETTPIVLKHVTEPIRPSTPRAPASTVSFNDHPPEQRRRDPMADRPHAALETPGPIVPTRRGSGRVVGIAVAVLVVVAVSGWVLSRGRRGNEPAPTGTVTAPTRLAEATPLPPMEAPPAPAALPPTAPTPEPAPAPPSAPPVAHAAPSQPAVAPTAAAVAPTRPNAAVRPAPSGSRVNLNVPTTPAGNAGARTAATPSRGTNNAPIVE